MIPSYRKKRNIGFILTVIIVVVIGRYSEEIFAVSPDGNQPVALGIFLVCLFTFFWGYTHWAYAKAKGYPGSYGIKLSIVAGWGFFILIFRRDQSVLLAQQQEDHDPDVDDEKEVVRRSDGSLYIGSVSNEQAAGHGTHMFLDDRRIVGEFRNDQPWKGVEFDSNGLVIGTYLEGIKTSGSQETQIATGNWTDQDILDTVFEDVSLCEVNFSGEDWSGRSFVRRDMRRANLSGAQLVNANLFDAHLVYTDFSSADLTGANLTEARAGSSIMNGTNLKNANLTDVNLGFADLSDANLTGANLTNADLNNANLNNADLSGADLTNATLFEADFSEVILTDIIFSNTTMPDGSIKSADSE